MIDIVQNLRNCPFCGGVAQISCVGKGQGKENLGVVVRCKNCGCGTKPIYPLLHFSYEARKNCCIETWNKRMA